MNRNRQLSNVYWRNAKPYLNWQSTQPSVNSTSKWTSFKSNTGNFMFQREPGWMQRPVAVWICLRGRTLTQFPTIPCNLQLWPIEAIASLNQVSVKRRLRTADYGLRTADCGPGVKCRLSVKSAVLIAFCTQPAFYSQSVVCILLSVCILPLVRTLRFTLTSLKLS